MPEYCSRTKIFMGNSMRETTLHLSMHLQVTDLQYRSTPLVICDLCLLLLGSIGLLSAFPIKGLIKGAWDVFGRIPNDDFLFKTDNLVDPKLLARTFTEMVRYWQ